MNIKTLSKNLFNLLIIGLVLSCSNGDNDESPNPLTSSQSTSDSSSCPNISNSDGQIVLSGEDSNNELTCIYSGTYNDSFTMQNNATHILSGPVKIGDDTTTPILTIQEGTTIRGESGKDSLNILRGAKIVARGSKTKPIIMTSASDDGTLAADAQAQWGGLQIMGKATQNCTDAEKKFRRYL